jgi:hypothetical protein
MLERLAADEPQRPVDQRAEDRRVQDHSADREDQQHQQRVDRYVRDERDARRPHERGGDQTETSVTRPAVADRLRGTS